jgi:hypothetical protein
MKRVFDAKERRKQAAKALQLFLLCESDKPYGPMDESERKILLRLQKEGLLEETMTGAFARTAEGIMVISKFARAGGY